MAQNCSTDTFEVDYCCRTDVGMRRSNNQDSIGWHESNRGDWPTKGHFFMVADGMGAHAAGELASKMAVDNIPHSYRKIRNQSPPAALRQAIRKANEQIYAKGQSSAEFHGMGTTCSCLVLLPEAAIVGHVGDSRVYRLRGGKLEQLTFDHSLVWEMAAASHTSADKVPSCIPKNVITRSLGPHPQVNVDLEGPFVAKPGDRYLLCSDGLTAVIEDQLMGPLLSHLDIEEAVETLISLANMRGGPDNISVIVAAIKGEPEPDSPLSCIPAKYRCRKRMAICLMAALAFAAVAGAGFAMNSWLVAVLAGMAAIASAAYGFSPIEQPSEVLAPDLGGPYGNGPYRDFQNSLERAAASLRETLDEMLELENDQNYGYVDWESFAKRRETTGDLSGKGEHARAMIEYAELLRDLKTALTNRKQSPDESGVLQI